MSDSYGQLTARAVQALTADPALVSAMSAPAQVSAFGLYEAIAGEVGKDLTAAVVGALPAGVANGASAVAMGLLKMILSIAQGQDAGTAVGELARTALDFVPLFGTVAGIMVDGAKLGNNAHLGIGPSSGNRDVRAAWCQAQFAAPDGSGPGKQVMPADIFSPAKNGYGETMAMSSLGRALRAMTNPDDVATYDSSGSNVLDSGSLAGVRKTADKLGKITGAANNPLKWAYDPKLGIPKKTQDLLRTLREAITGMRGHLETDGGVALMLVFTDVVRTLWDQGKMSEPYFWWLMRLDTDELDREVADPGETCSTHDRRAGQAAYDLVQGWRQTLSPYAQFSKPSEVAEAQGELLGRVQGQLDRNNRVALLAAALLAGPGRIMFGDLGQPRRRMGPIRF